MNPKRQCEEPCKVCRKLILVDVRDQFNALCEDCKRRYQFYDERELERM